eukprot:NODE_120_length_17920_cov_0.559782.p7 type:complete len:201 gc:universal NODE_120_length_17920_cov_0.559782:3388-2786(-)
MLFSILSALPQSQSTENNTVAVNSTVPAPNTQLTSDLSAPAGNGWVASTGPAKCIEALGQNQVGGGLTCHHTYNKEAPLEAGYGGCDLVKTSEGGMKDLTLVWEFAKKNGYMVKGGGNCFDLVDLIFNGKTVKVIVLDNGSAHDISIPAYFALTGVTPGPNCEDAVCPIGNFQMNVVGNVKAAFIEFAKSYANTTVVYTY